MKKSIYVIIGLLVWQSVSSNVIAQHRLSKNFQTGAVPKENSKLKEVDIIIKNASIFDGTDAGVITQGHILIKDGKIVQISSAIPKIKATKEIDATGKYVMPGLINSHLHLFWNMYDLPPVMPATNDAQAKEFIDGKLSDGLRGHLEHGITSILSPIDFSPYIFDVREKVENGTISGPRVFVAGPVLVNSGDYYACAGLEGDALKWCNDHVRLPINTVAEAKQSINKLVELKADVVVYDGLTNQTEFNAAALQALVNEAHKHHLKVLIHNIDAKNVPAAVKAGIDGFIHPPGVTKDVDGSLLNIVGEKKLPIAMTLGFMERYMKLGFANEKDKNDYEINVNNIQKIVKAGGIPIFTSDVPGIPPSEVVPMVTGVMKAQGVTNKTILLSATKEGAKTLGATNLGTLEKGKIADIILLDGNPLEDINALQHVQLVIKDGKVVVDKR